MDTTQSVAEIFGEPIGIYTRRQAIEDGVLIDLTEWASADKGFMGGFSCPVAVTSGVWAMIEAIPASAKGLQDVRGRAHDVLWMASLACRAAARADRSRAFFQVLMCVAGTRTKKHAFKVVAGGDDNGELAITIMGADED